MGGTRTSGIHGNEKVDLEVCNAAISYVNYAKSQHIHILWRHIKTNQSISKPLMVQTMQKLNYKFKPNKNNI